MKRYFIYACEQMYGGYHGMYTSGVFEFNDSWTEDEIYKEYVCQMSFEVMETYGEIIENLIDRDEYDDEEEYYEALDEAMWENVDGYALKIRDDVTLSTAELDRLSSELGEDLFVKRYCIH